MDELYRFQYSSISYPVDSNFVGDHGSSSSSIAGLSDNHNLVSTVAETHEDQATGLEMSDIIKAQIANHPLYPNLLSAYIECRKVGAPPEMASVLEEISKENHPISASSEIGTDPELDDFMKSYCVALHKYKEEISKPFDEATNFLSSIESQLSDLCKETLPSTTYSYHSADDAGCPSDEDLSVGELEASGSQESGNRLGGGDHELKEMLMRKYSGYLSSLRKEFLKKRKKEEEKNRLSEMTGLDQKQINNWFINQRKRHWRPSEDMRFALMEGVAGGVDASMYFDATGGTGGVGT